VCTSLSGSVTVPVWVQGTIGGETIRRSLNTGNWTAASSIVHQWHKSPRGPGHPAAWARRTEQPASDHDSLTHKTPTGISNSSASQTRSFVVSSVVSSVDIPYKPAILRLGRCFLYEASTVSLCGVGCARIEYGTRERQPRPGKTIIHRRFFSLRRVSVSLVPSPQ
jgi:hypothetical protein